MKNKFFYSSDSHYILNFILFKMKFKKQTNNTIYLIENNIKKKVKRIKGLKIVFHGRNSTVIINKPKNEIKNSLIEVGNNCSITIGHTIHRMNNLKAIVTADNSELNIGENFHIFNGLSILLTREPRLKVSIGNNCMFGSNVVLRTTDAHTILDKNNNIINYGKGIVIKDHVWLAMNVTVLKGVTISEGIVVGTGSIVTKDLSIPNSIYAGIPATHKKSDIRWDILNPYDYTLKQTEKGDNLV